MTTPTVFAEIRTRAEDVFATELRASCRLLLAYAGNPQISALLAGADEVFATQAFPPAAGTLAAAGWSNVRDLVTDGAQLQDAPQAAEYAPWQTFVELRLAPAFTAAAAITKPARLFLSV